MSVNSTCTTSSSLIDEELYFLILRLLEAGPCKEAFELLPKRWDWQGKEHHRSYEDLMSLNRHIASDHLKQICVRLSSLLDEKFGRGLACAPSLLGAGNHSLLRKNANVPTSYGLSACAIRRHGASLMLPHNVSTPPNVVRSITGREITGVACGGSRSCPPPAIYRQQQLQARVLGHLSAVYCVCYDRTGNYVFTGADDNIVKIWSSRSGRLLASLRGHSGEIADMTVSSDNSMLATGSCDHTVRVWCLQTTATVAVLRGHTGSVTSLQFCPKSQVDERYLLSTGADGCVCFWRYVSDGGGGGGRPVFDEKPLKFVERSRAGAQMLCSSFSTGGVFLAAGSMDHVIRMYSLHGPSPCKVAELEAHTDIVDSIQHSNYGTRFISGSSDGTARVWRYSSGARWAHIVLPVAAKLPESGSTSMLVPGCSTGRESRTNSSKLKVTMVCWSVNDFYVMTAVSDYSVKVWDSRSGQLMRVLQGHDGDVFVVEYSPVNASIMLTAGHDGRVIVWDVNKDQPVKVFFNEIQGQGYGAVYDCKFAPDGQSFAATDSHGHLLHFGFSVNERLKKLPSEMFFHTDYRPLVRDANDYVLDEQTQQPPHLMPPPFLVNIDGIPLAPEYQRLVPGRERCSHAQLVPQMGETPNGDREVLDQPFVPEPVGLPAGEQPDQPGQLAPAGAGQLDARIAALQREQDQRLGGADDGVVGSPEARSQPSGSSANLPAGVRRRDRMSSHSSARMRRNNEVEGVRQAVGNVPRSQRATASELSATRLRIVVEPLAAVALARGEDERAAFTEQEMLEALFSARQKPPSQSAQEQQDGLTGVSLQKKDASGSAAVNHGYRTRAARQQQQRQRRRRHDNETIGRNRLTARALYDTDDDEDYEDFAEDVTGDREAETTQTAADRGSTEDDEQWSDSSSSSSDSSDYSDWAPDGQANLQPPSRVSQRQTRRRRLSSASGEGEDADSAGDEPAGRGQRRPADAAQTRTASRSKKKSVRSSNDKVRRAKKRLSSAEIAARSMSAGSVQELPEAFRLPDWLTNTLPRRSPYFPQMGDEVIYFRQGHELYLEAVQRTAAYSLNAERSQPWHNNPQLREQELMKVVGIKYDVKPPRLCCVKLAYMDPVSKHLTGGSISVKYHDMPDVIDFIVLKQFYDQATGRDWKVGDRFRSVIDDQWWIGTIRSHEPLSAEFPDSFYQCFVVEWENGETERMSPWDLEPLPQRRGAVGNGVHLTSAELQQLQYTPHESEWPEHGRDEECRRLSSCFERVMEYGVAEHFAAPVDFSIFPLYAMTIGYPIDLSTIKARLDSRFYRRVNAIQFDVRHIESNARAFNEPNAPIVRSAELVAELCLNIIRDINLIDPRAVYAQLIGNARYANCVGVLAAEEAAGSPEASLSGEAADADEVCHSSTDVWKELCRQLLDVIFECGDSEPFRQPVDPLEYPDYFTIIDCPADFGTIREQLSCGVYSSPLDFSKDVKQVFTNSKAYNTNKRSKIYAMTLRLQAMVDQRMNTIVLGWRNAVATASKRSSRSRHQHDRTAGVSELSRQAAAVEKSRSAKSQTRIGSGSSDVDLATASASQLPPPYAASNDTEASGRRPHPEVEARADSSRQSRVASNRSAAAPRQTTRRGPHSEPANGVAVAAGHGANGHRQGPSSPAVDTAGHSKAGSVTGSSSNAIEGQYVTRARTGNLKPKLYSDDAFLSGDSDDECNVASRDRRQPNCNKISVRIKKFPEVLGRNGGGDDGCQDAPSSRSGGDNESGHAPMRRCPQRACRTAATAAAMTAERTIGGGRCNGSSPPAVNSDRHDDSADGPRSPPADLDGQCRVPRATAARRGTAPAADPSSSSASSGDDTDDFSRSSSSSSSCDEVNARRRQRVRPASDDEELDSVHSDDFDDDESSGAITAVVAGCRTRAGCRQQAANTNSSRPEARQQQPQSKRLRHERSATSESDSSSSAPTRAKRRCAVGAGDGPRQAAFEDSDESPDRSIGGSGSSRDPSWRRESCTVNRGSAAVPVHSNGSTAAVNSAARGASRPTGEAAVRRPRRGRPVDYREMPSSDGSDDDDGEEDGERHFTESVVTTVSSRGRVRKLTSRARESFAL